MTISSGKYELLARAAEAGDPEAKANLGCVFYSRKQYHRAVDCFQEALSFLPRRRDDDGLLELEIKYLKSMVFTDPQFYKDRITRLMKAIQRHARSEGSIHTETELGLFIAEEIYPEYQQLQKARGLLDYLLRELSLWIEKLPEDLEEYGDVMDRIALVEEARALIVLRERWVRERDQALQSDWSLDGLYAE